MSVKRINSYVKTAINSLQSRNVAVDGIIKKSLRSQISSFGSDLRGGNIYAVVLDYSKDQEPLMQCLYDIIKTSEYSSEDEKLKEYVIKLDDKYTAELTSVLLDAAAALKIAMNYFTFDDDDDNK